MTWAILLEQAFNGLQFGMMLFLMAVGVTLVFGIMDTVNLSHGVLPLAVLCAAASARCLCGRGGSISS